ncbi:MAG: ParB/RepB/Spo0J family partition protein [Acidobacteriota bacterium]|nr:MAG: ParB/RepB/Spo0J family partition protein [Acidobacteriota bacterium]
MAERGLPLGIKMRHDSHYVEELAKANRSVGRVIPVDRIEPNPDQPRNEIGDLAELSASIKNQGVLEPLLVKPREDGTYMIIAGERRWRASKLAGLTEVPCIELDIDENTIAEIALVENLQRKDLTIWEVADGLLDLTVRFGYTHDDIAEKIGKSRSTVTESIAIAGLPEEIRQRCLEGDITAKSVLIEISRQFDEEAMHALLDEILDKDLKRTDIREKTRTEKDQKKSGKSETLRKEAAQAKAQAASEEVSEPEPEPEVASAANTFAFAAEDGSFELQISFASEEEYSRKDILIALKNAFDAVKSGRPEE